MNFVKTLDFVRTICCTVTKEMQVNSVRRIEMLKYSSRKNAESVVANAIKIMMIVLGDDGMFWVVTPAVAQQLVAQGYELA